MQRKELTGEIARMQPIMPRTVVQNSYVDLMEELGLPARQDPQTERNKRMIGECRQERQALYKLFRRWKEWRKAEIAHLTDNFKSKL